VLLAGRRIASALRRFMPSRFNWSRPGDLSDYVALGGFGILIRNGTLNYRRENIFETYYAVFLAKETTFRLSVRAEPGLQRRSRSCLDLLRPRTQGFLACSVMTHARIGEASG
jgi:hypothetical protein